MLLIEVTQRVEVCKKRLIQLKQTNKKNTHKIKGT